MQQEILEYKWICVLILLPNLHKTAFFAIASYLPLHPFLMSIKKLLYQLTDKVTSNKPLMQLHGG